MRKNVRFSHHHITTARSDEGKRVLWNAMHPETAGTMQARSQGESRNREALAKSNGGGHLPNLVVMRTDRGWHKKQTCEISRPGVSGWVATPSVMYAFWSSENISESVRQGTTEGGEGAQLYVWMQQGRVNNSANGAHEQC